MWGGGRVHAIKCLCGTWVKPRRFNNSWRLCVACAKAADVRLAQLDRTWPQIMTNCRLTVKHYSTTYTPRVLDVFCSPLLDVLTVQVVPGQMRADVAKHAARIAEALGARQVKVQSGSAPDLLTVFLYRGDPLVSVVGPLPIQAVPNLAALPLGRRENGQVWALCLPGNQVLVVGATNSGKGSVAQSLVRSLAGGIASGTVRVWGFDPKGGMELAAGEPLYDRFLFGSVAEMAAALDEAVQVLEDRSQRLRGRTRQHVASVDEPTYVLVIDELAALTAYNQDKNLRERIKNSLATILTKGRAVGVHVVALVQDGRKEVVPFRNLFTVRIGLRLNEADEVDLVLGDGARDRGALCDLIPTNTPGVAYALSDDRTTPERIRFSYPTDADITAMAAEYARPTAGKES